MARLAPTPRPKPALFEPNDALARQIVRSLPGTGDSAFSPGDLRKAKREIGKRFKQAVGTFAIRQRIAGAGPVVSVAENGHFLDALVDQLRLSLPVAEGSEEIANELFRQFFEFCKNGKTLMAKWGTVTIAERGLCITPLDDTSSERMAAGRLHHA